MLTDYRVLDMTHGGYAIAGQMLADLGADVVLVEPPGGLPTRQEHPFRKGQKNPDSSLSFWGTNRGKRSAVLDLTTDEGKRQFRQLARGADVILESYAPGYLAGLGLGYEDLAKENPGLVMVSVTPFGQTGPKAGWKATDLTVWAATGALAMAGDDDRAPVGLSVPQGYLHAGAEAAVGAMIALAGRQRDGLGQHVDVSAQTAGMMATQATILSAGWNEVDTKRMAGGVKFGPLPLRFVNPAKDGYVSVTFLFGSAIGPFSRRLMEVMHEEGFVDEATRDKDWINYTTLILSGQEPVTELFRCIEAISRFTSSHTMAQLMEMAMAKSLLIVPVNTVAEVVQSPQLAAREYFQRVRHEELGEEVVYPGPFARMGSTPIRYTRRPPLLGEHTAEVLREQRRPAPVTAGSGGGLPLAGLKVVEFTWVVAGPWGVRYLSDYGATVIKVESTTRVDTARTIGPFKDKQPGPERSGAYATVNAGKYGLSLNLSTPEGKAAALKLCAWADVVTESFAAGSMERLGLGYETLRKANPGLIMLSSCLNGQTGPQATLAGFGTMGAQIAGFGDLAGWPDRAPAGPAGAYTDYIAPKFTAAAILAALEHRRKTGEGQYIDFSQSECSAHFLAPAILDYTVNGNVQSRMGNASLDYAPHGVYPVAGDDCWAAIAADSDEAWQALSRVAGQGWASDSRFATVEARMANREALDAVISAWTADKEPGQLEELLQGAGVPCHRVVMSADAFADPQLAARGHFVTVTHPEYGEVPVETSRMRFSRTPAPAPGWPGPTFGQHNDKVLHEILGMTEDEVVELVAAGALE